MKNCLTIIILITSLLLFISGCKVTKESTDHKEQVNNYASIHNAIKDSIIIWKHDSILVCIAGDTVLKEVFRTQYRDRFHYDTLKITDSIYIDKLNTIVRTETKTTNILKWWQKTFIYLGIAAVLITMVKIYKQLF